jgi:hypothetical protein
MTNGPALKKEKDKPKKERKKSVSKLKKVLWSIFTKYIKARDKNICVTCGKYVTSYEANGGHYIAKAACGADYYFHEKNVHCQCTYCNLTLEGNRPVYRQFILNTYGQEVLNDLETNYRKANPKYPYEQKIQEYKEKIENL